MSSRVSYRSDGSGALAQTAALLEQSSVPAIYEATFRHSNVLVRVDILQRLPSNQWRLIEVKSSVEPKSHYLTDVAIQRHIVASCGLDVSSACLMYLNREYRYDGREHDTRDLFKRRDVTKEIAEIETGLPALLIKQREALADGAPPDIGPGPQCSAPYVCEFFRQCNPKLPPHHISSLPRLSEKKATDLMDRGFTLIQEIPEDFPLTETQSRVWSAVKSGHPWVSETLDAELATLRWPLYFMDFESLFPAIPRFADMWPYSQIPFQWSVHRMMEPDAKLEHFEFLAEDERDPRREFIDSLCDVLGTHGHIVVYNAGFESQRLRELAGRMPEHSGRIETILERLWDLLPFVRRHVYTRSSTGRFRSRPSCLPWSRR